MKNNPHLTVQALATQLQINTDTLLGKLKEAGIPLNKTDDIISKEQKLQLLNLFRNQSSQSNKKPTLLKVQSTQGKKINILIKQKNTVDSQAKIENAKKIKKQLNQKRDVLKFQPQAVNPKKAESIPPSTSKETTQTPAQEQTKTTPSTKKKKIHIINEFDATKEVLQKHKFEKPENPINYEVKIPEFITVEKLAESISMKASEMIQHLMKAGIMATKNQSIDQETAFLIIEEMGHTPILEEQTTQKILKTKIESKNQKKRPPIITIMGHVDHGKTTLIDYFRKSKITKKESGGITQHIGAYQINTPKGKITFIDTPGHAAFSNMRIQGTNLTDIVILVVAADDGIMPQTIEAIECAKKADVPIIVAINKIDKPGAKVEQIQKQLTQYEIVSEQWGGSHLFFNISALTGEGIDLLLEGILLQAEILEIKAAQDVPATGMILESKIKKGLGASATLLIQHGLLKKGQIIVASEQYARIRNMTDENENTVNIAEPAMPVEITGFSGIPEAGEEFLVVKDEKIARELVEQKRNELQEIKIQKRSAVLQKRALEAMQNSDIKILTFLIKSDTKGTSYALNESILKLQNEKASINIISFGVGGINESDINLANNNKTMVIGFNVRADSATKKLAQMRDIEIRYYSVIYQVLEDIQNMIQGQNDGKLQEKILGIAEVIEVFKASKYGEIAGCIVKEGLIKFNNPIRVLRDSKVVHEGKLESLRRFKDNVNEVGVDIECGIGVKNYKNVQIGDQIEVFEKQGFHKTHV